MIRAHNSSDSPVYSRFERYYLRIKANRWYWYFSLFCRFSLALGFIIAGMVKIVGERFASGLSPIHPMGAYLEALHHTGYYYTFIGIGQVVAALLLLIPRTAALGAVLYFPIIVNIWVLSWAVRFDGSFVSAPLMVLANLFLLVWYYDRLHLLLPLKRHPDFGILQRPKKLSNRFPWAFFTGVLLTGIGLIAFSANGYEVMPRNSEAACRKQFAGTPNEPTGNDFCACIHRKGKSLEDCLQVYQSKKIE